MEPLDKDAQTISPLENTAKQKIENQPIVEQSKHNNLLIVLLLVLVFVIASFGALMVYQSKLGKDEKASTSTDSTESLKTPAGAPVANTAASSDQLDEPVTSNIDSELNNLDSSIKSQNDTNFSDSSLSDANLGL